MIEPATPLPQASRTAAAPASEPPGDAPDTFHAILSALNPLQYLPVVGTIYRAATGDEVAEPVRRIGSAVTSFLIGGPIGLGLNLASLGVEKVLGIDLDKTAQAVLTGASADPGAGKTPKQAVPAPTGSAAWSPTQLAAYGVGTQGDGTLVRGDVVGADVLNMLELGRIQQTRLAAGSTVSLAV